MSELSASAKKCELELRVWMGIRSRRKGHRLLLRAAMRAAGKTANGSLRRERTAHGAVLRV